MPLFDFQCSDCQKQFEELVIGSESPACSNCGSQNVERLVSAPSPQKTGAFPYKVGPVHSSIKMQNNNSCGGSCKGSCSTNS